MNKTKHLKGHCQACGGHLEFPAEAAGMSVDCPHCGKKTDLWLAPPPEEPVVPRRTIIWTAITVLILLAGLAGGVVALKQAEKGSAAKRQTAQETSPSATSDSQPEANNTLPDPIEKEPFAASEITMQKTPGTSLVYAVGTLTNNSDRQHFGVKVFLDLFDSSGKKIGQATDYQQMIEAKGTWGFKALVMQSRTVTAKLSTIREDQ